MSSDVQQPKRIKNVIVCGITRPEMRPCDAICIMLHCLLGAESACKTHSNQRSYNGGSAMSCTTVVHMRTNLT